jgi:putative mRNA 3-end processing factor
MSILPKTKSDVINECFKQATKDAEDGSKTSDWLDLFKQSNELLVAEILRKQEKEFSGLNDAKVTHDRLNLILRDAISEIRLEDYLSSGTLALYGFLLDNYNEEDFRYVYRYSLQKVKDQKQVTKWLKKALVFLAICKKKSNREYLSYIREWIHYLGAPVFSPFSLLDVFKEFGVDVADVLDEEDFRLVDTLRRHSQYLEEAVTAKPYNDIRAASKQWLPDVIASKLLSIYKSRAYESAQEHVSPDADVEKAFKSVKKYFEKSGFTSDDGSVFPVKLQELKNPPAPEAVDPIVFELIPQKLRVRLLPSVAYTTKTKTVEIVFIGGPRIGHSGILIKTDTGGILLDYGLSVASQQIPGWVPELEMIDTVLVSHSHLDHIGGLPILYDTYDGKWCSTGITGAITKVLLDDALKIGTPLPPRRRDKWDLISRFKRYNIDRVSRNHVRLEYGKTCEVGPGILVTPVDACHIPGSASFVVDIEGLKLLYTGDFNTDRSVLFPGSTLPNDCNVVMYDGTYWDREDFDREKIAQEIYEVIQNHGPVIIPSFAVGRSQEMLMILDNLGVTEQRNVMVAGMAEQVTKLVGLKGKWSGMKKNKVVLDKDDVLVAGGGMMSGGLARHHFKEQRSNPKAAVILCGYLAPRTPGWNLLHGYEPHSCHVQYARISAHSSAGNLKEYVSSCKGKKVMIHTPYQGVPKGIAVPEYKSRIVLKT